MPPEVTIEIRSVRKVFARRFGKSVTALDGVSLEIRRGETFGLIGPNGAGKTTLLSCLLGFLRPTQGDIRVEGMPVDDLSIRASTGYLPERLGFDRFQTGRSFLMSHFRLAGGSGAEAGAAARESAAQAGLEEPALSQRLRTYSRGMLQRIGMAQALLRQPRFLFLDEPASGIDPAGVRAIRQRILDARSRAVTTVLNSHQLPEIEKVCDRVAFLERGRIVRVESLRGSDALRKAKLRVAAGQEARAIALLAEAGLAASASPDGALRFLAHGEPEVAEAARRICAAGVSLYELTSDADLESLFSEEGR